MKQPARVLLALAAALPALSFASSHREAPFISGMPQVDGTDFYMFRSYEPGRSDYVTFIASYIPFESPSGGPNFYPLDPHAIYAINVSNDGGASADISFEFTFTTMNKNFAVQAGNQSVAIPLINDGPVDTSGKALNVQQSYRLTVYRNGNGWPATNVMTGGETFYKPADNIGNKSIPDYASYASNFVYDVMIPGCPAPGRVFVGQRKDGFVVNLGDIFDLVNTNPAGPRDAEPNTLTGFNVTSLALEVPIKCLTHGNDPVIGAWTTSRMPRELQVPTHWSSQGEPVKSQPVGRRDYVQVSRLGMPLVNEVVIGLPDKDRWNGSRPRDDAQFLEYVTHPSLPVLLNALFGSAAMVPATPRNDLVTVFLTGIKGLNQPANVQPAEMLRLNTSIAPTPPASQNDLGVLGGDNAGFPNGRRPFDDVVDITLRAAEGALCGAVGSCGSETSDPNHGTPYTDGARAAGADASSEAISGAISPADTYLDAFPYLNTPRPGSPNGPNGVATTPPPSTTTPE
ncbi:MAG: DUF4331 domain-containing protein [Gammaproteobacteria bacterium]|nr:DUF4331 domain-containing protein [Gammaproteobacteria bacterium]